MNDFLITVYKGQVKVARIVEGQLEPIRFCGTEWIAYEQFWSQFLKKIEYQPDERLALILISDDTYFTVDKNIQIASQFACDDYQLVRLIGRSEIVKAQVQLFPEINLTLAGAAVAKVSPHSEAKMAPNVETKVKSHSATTADSEGSIQSYFRKQTQAYSND